MTEESPPPRAGPAGAVCLSYASQDTEAAQRICEALRAAGTEVWFDQSELRGGDAWDQKIRREIHDCALFVPVISANTVARHEGYFRLEWDLADQRTHMIARNRAFIVPVCLDATPDAGADVPESFLRVQWTRLPDGATSPAFVERVSQLLLHAEPHAPTQARPLVGTTSRARTFAGRRSALLVTAVIVMIGVGYFALERLVLSKRSAAGPQTLASTSQAGAPGQGAIPEKSIAVLPFVNMSSDKEQEYFSDGLAEELLNLLAQVAELRVPGRTSSFYFKGKQATIAEIAKALGVAHVLEGSVRKAGETLRVTVQLIRADNGYHLWAKTYDRNVKDVFKVQDEIAAAVVAALKVQLLPSQQVTNAHRTDNPEAYRQYLLGLQLYRRSTADDYRRAIASFDRAITLDPNYAAAYVARTDAKSNLASDSGMSRVSPELRADVDKALALAPDLAEGFRNRGMVRFFEYDWSAAEADLKKALALNPGDTVAQRRYGYFLASQGRFPAAITAVKQAQAIDPLEPISPYYLALIETAEGRYQAAEQALQQSLEINKYQRSLRVLAIVEILEGRTQDAAAICPQLTLDTRRWACQAMTQHALGRTVESQQALQQLLKTDNALGAFEVAGVYAMLGDANRAFEWIDRAYAGRPDTLALVKIEASMVSLHADPRYKALLRKMNLPE